jgi:hypothetical protein
MRRRKRHTTTACEVGSSAAGQPTLPSTDPERKAKDEEARYAAYLDERKILIEGEQQGADHLDKNILTLAGGALAISLVFIEKIAPEPKPSTLIYLYLGWGALVVSLCAMLSSFLTSQKAYRCQRTILEEVFFSEPGNPPNSRNYWALVTGGLNWGSIFIFIVGVGMIVTFSTLNMGLKALAKTPASGTVPAVTNQNPTGAGSSASAITNEQKSAPAVGTNGLTNELRPTRTIK